MWLNLVLACNLFALVVSKVDETQYSTIPEIFHYDNFDRCMTLGDNALYCSVTYELQPLNNEVLSETWLTIKSLSVQNENYNHSKIRHWICVRTSCPKITNLNVTDLELKSQLGECFNEKFAQFGLKGVISKLERVIPKSKRPFDLVDKIVGVLFVSYAMVVFYATATRKSSYSTRSLDYFALDESWTTLKTVKSTPEIDKLRCLQGLRVYNSAIVVLLHTVLGFLTLPVANFRHVETIREKPSTPILANGNFAVLPFFFISSFLVSNSIFSSTKGKSFSFKDIITTIRRRFLRLTPSLLVVIMFHATFLRHLGEGPNWLFIDKEFRSCRRNWWTNVFYINNWINPTNMCLQVTWTLGFDMQYHIVSLLLIWVVKKFEKLAYGIFGCALFFNVAIVFVRNYHYNFPALLINTPESFYDMAFTRGFQFHYQYASFIGNLSAPLVALAFGYYYSSHKNDEQILINTQVRKILWRALFWGLIIFLVIIMAGLLESKIIDNILWDSLYVALSRPLLAFAIGVMIYGVSQGVEGLTKKILEWPPTYILGKLTFSLYLVHSSLIFWRAGMTRYPSYVSDSQIFFTFMGDFSTSFIAALLLTLFVEIPFDKLTRSHKDKENLQTEKKHSKQN